MSTQTTTEDRAAQMFDGDLAEHTMTVLHADELHRQIRFATPHLTWFDLVTWPHNLVVNGSHGSYHFCLTPTRDLFELFRDGAAGRRINPGYWAEKLRTGAAKSWSEEKFREWLLATAAGLEARHPGIAAAVDEQILSEDSEHSIEYETTAAFALASFQHDDGTRILFPEPWNRTFEDYDHHYLWSCHAAVWGIQQYDLALSEVRA